MRLRMAHKGWRVGRLALGGDVLSLCQCRLLIFVSTFAPLLASISPSDICFEAAATVVHNLPSPPGRIAKRCANAIAKKDSRGTKMTMLESLVQWLCYGSIYSGSKSSSSLIQKS